MTITPEKLGDEFLARLFAILHKAGQLAALPCISLDTGLNRTLGDVLNSMSITPTGVMRSLVPPLDIASGGLTCTFNSEHRVDVVIEGSPRSIAVEAKLGLTTTPTWFGKTFNGDPVEYEPSNCQLKGNMISILERRFDTCSFVQFPAHVLPPAAPLRVRDSAGQPVDLADRWVLVLRSTVWDELRKKLRQRVKGADVVTFEDLASRARDVLGGNTAFDQLVFDTIGKGFAEAWGL